MDHHLPFETQDLVGQMRTDVPIQVDPNQLIIYPGYTFCPTDEDVLYYLKQKAYGIPVLIDFILDQNVYEVPPWQLRSMFLFLLPFYNYFILFYLFLRIQQVIS